MAAISSSSPAPQDLADILAECGKKSAPKDLGTIISLIVKQSGLQSPLNFPPSLMQVLTCIAGKI